MSLEIERRFMCKTNNFALIIERNLINLCIKAANISCGEVVKQDNYSWAKNSYFEGYNKVFDINIPLANIKEVIMLLRKNIELEIAPKHLLINSYNQPIILEDFLKSLNFDMFYQQSGMAMDLASFKFGSNDSIGKIRTIKSANELEDWILITEEAFKKKRNSHIYIMFLNENDIRFYGCYYKDKIVATLMLYIKDAIAGIYLVSTANEFRGKGFGTLIAKTALRDAKDLGCKYSVLQASDMGRTVYNNIGFKEYCKIRNWEYNKL
jgi:GNAT superfamily N-acetyltransferase